VAARSVLALNGAMVAAVGVVGFAWPATRPFGWAAVGFGGAIAMLIGVARHRPRRRWPWVLFAMSLAGSAAGELAYGVPHRYGAAPLGTVADVCLAAVIPAAALALSSLATTGSRCRDRAGAIDAFTVTLALGVVAWATLVDPAVPTAPLSGRLAVFAYPLGDVLLLSALVRMFGSRRRTVATDLLALGTVAVLVADVGYLACVTAGVRNPGGPLDAGWLILSAAWSAAALHPSMTRLTEPEALPSEKLTVGRVSMRALTSVTPPVVLIVEASMFRVRDGVVLGVLSAIIYLINLIRITRVANANRRSLVHREHHDALTGLPNRALFTDRLTEAITGAAGGGPRPGLVVLDIDTFKLLNDSMGQSAGDEVLAGLAARLVRVLGRRDMAARLGEDEFAVLVAAASSPDAVEAMTRRITASLVEPFAVAGKPVPITVSLGMTDLCEPVDVTALSADVLLSHADLALQSARLQGRGSIQRYRPAVHDPMVERMRLRAALERAVQEGAFTLRFQPIVALDTGVTVGFEALVRWEHPTRGPVSPAEFIEIAEESGLIDPIGDWVLRRAVLAAAQWQRPSGPSPYVSVNVSARQFRNPGFAERVDRQLAAAGLPPSRLMIELTESVLFKGEDHVWAELASMRDTGIRLAIDDFGTGFSSLSYLLQTPIDVIKVDRSFVGTLASSQRQRALVNGIVGLAQTLGLLVVAEGIENPVDRDILAEMGCPYGQGYLYSIPLTGAETVAWLATEALAAPTGSGLVGPIRRVDLVS
jgi:diguanylate cyclase (GGDEF)-like protein